jgi:hypothetical protein
VNEKETPPDGLAVRLVRRMDAVEANLEEIGRLNRRAEAALELSRAVGKGAFIMRWQFRRDARRHHRTALRLLADNEVLLTANAVDLASSWEGRP